MTQSMSRAGDCYDNAFMESCFGTIKTELEMTTYDSLEQALYEITEYINYYNVLRRHSELTFVNCARPVRLLSKPWVKNADGLRTANEREWTRI